MIKYIVISGNPIDGFFFNGPFDDREDAVIWAEQESFRGDWWIGELESQDNYDH